MIFSFYILRIIKHKIRKSPVRNKKVYQKKGELSGNSRSAGFDFSGKDAIFMITKKYNTNNNKTKKDLLWTFHSVRPPSG